MSVIVMSLWTQALCFWVEVPVFSRLTTSVCTAPTEALTRMAGGGKNPCRLVLPHGQFSSFLSYSCIIFCSVKPCGMKSQSLSAKKTGRTLWQCGNTTFSASLYSQGVRLRDFFMVLTELLSIQVLENENNSL